MRIPDFLLSELNKIVAPERTHLLEPDASLAEVGIDAADRLTLACAIDETLLTEIPDAELMRWKTVGDVAESANKRGALRR